MNLTVYIIFVFLDFSANTAVKRLLLMLLMTVMLGGLMSRSDLVSAGSVEELTHKCMN